MFACRTVIYKLNNAKQFEEYKIISLNIPKAATTLIYISNEPPSNEEGSLYFPLAYASIEVTDSSLFRNGRKSIISGRYESVNRNTEANTADLWCFLGSARPIIMPTEHMQILRNANVFHVEVFA